MLQQLLDEIRSGGVLESKALAARLHTTPEMVDALLEHLQRTGYLRPYSARDDGCQGCALQPGCAAQGETGLRLWILDESFSPP
jgi:hypothetical protein